MHTSRIGHLLPVCLINNGRRAGFILEHHTKFGKKSVKNCGRIKSILINFNSIRIFVTNHGKMWPPQSWNCQNWILHISKKSVIYFRFVSETTGRPHFWAARKVLWKMVKNCVRHRYRQDEIDTETEICTSLKSEFYFRFHWQRI